MIDFQLDLIEYLMGQPLYRALAETFQTDEGNLFERADKATIEAQLATIAWVVGRTTLTPSPSPKGRGELHILETGTNKGFFGFLMCHMIDDGILYTFDIDERAGRAAQVLDAGQAVIEVRFTLGDTKETLAQFNAPIDLAWIDGGHDAKTAYCDIGHAMRLGAQWVLVDDVRGMASVAVAVVAALEDHPEYERVHNPWWEDDTRGIAVLRKVS